MSNICLLVLIGLPGAGKSYFCKYLQQCAKSEIDITHVSFDQIENEIGRNTYKGLRTNIQDRIITLLQKKMKDNVKSIVLLDDNMYYRSMRRSYYNLAKQYGIGYCQVYVVCSVDIAIERNNTRSDNKVPQEVIQEMATKLEPPGDNNWEKYSCNLYSDREYSEKDLTQIWDTIQLAMKNPVHAEDRSHCRIK